MSVPNVPVLITDHRRQAYCQNHMQNRVPSATAKIEVRTYPEHQPTWTSCTCGRVCIRAHTHTHTHTHRAIHNHTLLKHHITCTNDEQKHTINQELGLHPVYKKR